jgi:predicted ArsR family transcriptional regulator
MDTILLVLALSPAPLLASEIAGLVGRPTTAVRATLARLHEAGFAASEQIGTRGPVGTYRWRATVDGIALVAPLAAFVTRGRR